MLTCVGVYIIFASPENTYCVSTRNTKMKRYQPAFNCTPWFCAFYFSKYNAYRGTKEGLTNCLLSVLYNQHSAQCQVSLTY